MEATTMPQDKLFFKPTNQYLSSTKELTKAHCEFYTGELDEDYALFCTKEAIHAFWVNYSQREIKCDKQAFGNKLKILINELLSEL
jgi:hypothetical protein